MHIVHISIKKKEGVPSFRSWVLPVKWIFSRPSGISGSSGTAQLGLGILLCFRRHARARRLHSDRSVAPTLCWTCQAPLHEVVKRTPARRRRARRRLAAAVGVTARVGTTLSRSLRRSRPDAITDSWSTFVPMDFRFTNLLGAPYRGGNLLLHGTELISAVGNRVSVVRCIHLHCS